MTFRHTAPERRLGWLICTCAGIALAAGQARAEDPSPGPPSGVGGWLSSVVIDGRIEIGATLNPANPDTGINFGQLFTDKANQVVLNQFDLRAERPVGASGGRFDLGFAVEGFYGLDSQFTHFMGIGDQGSSGRNSFDLVQANVLAFAPIAREVGVEVKAGLFVTPMGFERLDPTQNFFYSNSYIFNFGLPRKHTGVLTTTHVGPDVDVYLGADTGANASAGVGGGVNDSQPHVLGGVGVRLGQVSVAGFTHIGPEDTSAELPPGVNPHRQLRFTNDLTADWTVSPRMNLAAELNYVYDQGLRAHAGAGAGYLTYELSPVLSAGVRAEVWRDAQGAFVAEYPGNLDYLDAEEGLPNHAFHPGPATYGEASLGMDIRPALTMAARALADSPFRQMTIRPEIRYDRVLAGDSGFGARPGSARDQMTFAVDVVTPLDFRRQPGQGGRHFSESLPADATEGEPQTAEAASKAIITARDNGAPAPTGPGPLAALGAAQILLTTPRTLQDLEGYAPDVTLARSAAGPAVAAYVRGLGDSAPHTGQAPAVGLELDGVEIDGAVAQLLDPWDLAGLSVTYGPSGLDQGRDADAGAIALESEAPTRAWGLDGQYGLGQGFHATNARARLNAPLGDAAGLEVTFSHRQRGGDLDNVYLGEGLYGGEETTLARARLAWNVTPTLDAELAVTAGHLDGQGLAPALGDTLDAGALAGSGLQADADGSPFQPASTRPLGPYQTAAGQPNGESLTAQVYSLTLRDRSALGELTSITAFVHERQDTAQDLDGGCAPSNLEGLTCPVIANPLVGALDASVAQTYRQVTEELSLDHAFSTWLEARVGGFFIHDETWRGQLTRTAVDAAAPTPAAAQSATARETSLAGFAELDVHPTSRLSASGIVRWVSALEDFQTGVSPGLSAGPAAPGFSGQSDVRRVLSRLAADYRLSEAVQVFADRTTGFRPGGMSLAASLAERVPGQANFNPADPNAQLATFAPESDTSYELGVAIKALDGALTGRLTGFAARISNLQFAQVVLTPGFGPAFDTYVVNLPRVDEDGAELSLAWRPSPVRGLTLSGEWSFLNSRVVAGLVPAAQVPVGPDQTAGAAGALADLTGTPLVRAPRLSGAVRADYELPLGPGKVLFDAAYVWTDRYALADVAAQGDEQGAYGAANFSIGYERSFYRITVSARNLLNQAPYAAAWPAFFSHAWGDPRTVEVSLGAAF